MSPTVENALFEAMQMTTSFVDDYVQIMFLHVVAIIHSLFDRARHSAALYRRQVGSLLPCSRVQTFLAAQIIDETIHINT